MLSSSVVGGSGTSAFAIDATTGRIIVADETQLDYETTPSFTLEVQVADDDNATDTATVTIDLLNQASITGVVFVDVNENGVYEANEPGIDGITIELLDEKGVLVLDTLGNPVVYNEYVLQPSGPNGVESVYTGKIQIVDLQTMSRQTLSLSERYPPENWNLASECYIVPDQEKMLLAIKKEVDVNRPGPTYWNPRLRHRKLLQPLHLLVVDLRRATIEKRILLSEGGSSGPFC